MVVATAAADVGNLRFYQRCGFRFAAVERDAFVPATGYPEPIVIDGIPLLDRVWLDQDLAVTGLRGRRASGGKVEQVLSGERVQVLLADLSGDRDRHPDLLDVLGAHVALARCASNSSRARGLAGRRPGRP